MVIGFLNTFLNISLLFFSARWRLSAGCTGPAKAMVNKSGLKVKLKQTQKGQLYTLYRVVDIKCGKYF